MAEGSASRIHVRLKRGGPLIKTEQPIKVDQEPAAAATTTSAPCAAAAANNAPRAKALVAAAPATNSAACAAATDADDSKRKNNAFSYRLRAAPAEVREAWDKLKRDKGSASRAEFIDMMLSVSRGDYSDITARLRTSTEVSDETENADESKWVSWQKNVTS